ncbi:hypothetical protein VTK56DRAFT_9964 [Thermocarpiscus australiensis]
MGLLFSYSTCLFPAHHSSAAGHGFNPHVNSLDPETSGLTLGSLEELLNPGVHFLAYLKPRSPMEHRINARLRPSLPFQICLTCSQCKTGCRCLRLPMCHNIDDPSVTIPGSRPIGEGPLPRTRWPWHFWKMPCFHVKLPMARENLYARAFQAPVPSELRPGRARECVARPIGNSPVLRATHISISAYLCPLQR